ncbi:MAG: nucleotidyltransferase domain-containing protein [Rhodoferax sp.]|nr:nucleotidyltransferase domain-containing protein [Rhodoferax sp.]
MAMFIEQSAAAQTAYAALAQAARQRDLQRSIADLPGGFVSKKIKGLQYWYYQYKMPDGQPQQIYVGPDDDSTQLLLSERHNPSAKQARSHLGTMCEAASVYGCYSVTPKHARVLARLADHGLFRAGGVLVGTHAYLSYQNRFGVLWKGGETTVDLDFAHPGRNISLAINNDFTIDAHAAIDSLKMGFLPVNAGTRYVKEDEPDFDLDFLTCIHRRGDEPVYIPQLNLTLQPLKFMEFSMQDPIVSVLIAASGPIVVNVPRPERYALAKLILYRERLDSRQPEKANKDLLQAATLIDYLGSSEPESLQGAWDDLLARGPGWRSRAKAGKDALHARYPEVGRMLAIA